MIGRTTMNPLKIKMDSLKLSDQQFYQLCQNNSDLRFERTYQGDLIIMPPTGGETGEKNSEINYQLRHWNKQYQLGKVFDSSTGFKLPNGADKSPDAAWIPLEKWTALTPEEKQGFVPLCPDFVIELRSPSDNLKPLQEKMQEYLENGTRLGWLINRQSREVEIYCQGQGVEIVENPSNLSGENVLPMFILDLDLIW
ncbi:Uma2 family endonuclease [Synechocystis sp. PCC 7339]|uniref:Uma2 family endonuclease n=1 Tax=Synechocystis sp. PCC 7339 TaxID=2782213 RepID=UPI00351CECD8